VIITIVGWYGTETIGDRAILCGLISYFNKAYDCFDVKIGSLNPFFTQRTLDEDYDFYKEVINKDINIEIFNSKDSKELLKVIKKSDLVAMGGGPMMDLDELFMVEYAFKVSKKQGVKTALLGCGVGPLFHKKFRKSVLEVSLNSDIIILRDSKSKENLKLIYQEFNKPFDGDLVNVSFDPSVECAIQYNKFNKMVCKDYIAVNLREFPLEYNKKFSSNNIDNEIKTFIELLSNKYEDKEILLIPMHYFHIGGDDRVFLNSIALDVGGRNIQVHNKNLTLKQTIEIYRGAKFNIGMRFHSVVLQTISSGKNYVLDYTEPVKGKISGFLNDIDKELFYKNRYISLQQDKVGLDFIQNTGRKFDYNVDEIIGKMAVYVEKLSELKR
jgi:polysaccharide pyruvyl transferase WcaK-like protein